MGNERLQREKRMGRLKKMRKSKIENEMKREHEGNGERKNLERKRERLRSVGIKNNERE